MALFTGYIKLHRRLLNWQWYGDAAVKSVFIHLLLTANYKETEWNGIVLQPGQVVTSVRKLCEDLHQTNQQTRTALDKLKATNEITVRTTNKYSVITVVNWAKYQSDNDECSKQNNKQINGQTTNKTEKINKQINNSIRNIRNNKEIKELLYCCESNKAKSEQKNRCGKYHNVFLTHSEYEEVFNWDSGCTLEKFSERLHSRGYKYADHYLALKKWHDQDDLKTGPAEISSSSYDMTEFERRADALPVYRKAQ